MILYTIKVVNYFIKGKIDKKIYKKIKKKKIS